MDCKANIRGIRVVQHLAQSASLRLRDVGTKYRAHRFTARKKWRSSANYPRRRAAADGGTTSPPTRSAGTEVKAIFAAKRLARDPALKQRLRTGTVALTGPVALLEARTLAAPIAPTIQARLLGLTMSAARKSNPTELALLAKTECLMATAHILAKTARCNVPDEPALDSLLSVLRKGFARIPS